MTNIEQKSIEISTYNKQGIGRYYKTPYGDFPSVTTILNNTSYKPWLEQWKKKVGEIEAARISKIATDRGEAVHSFAERYFNGEVDIWEEVKQAQKQHYDIYNMTYKLIECVKENINEVWKQELAVWHKKLQYAGRLDMVGIWKNEPTIIDFKTSKHFKSSIDKDYYIQVSCYAMAYNLMFQTTIKKFAILVTVQDREVQLFEGNIIPYMPEVKLRVNQFYIRY